MIAIKSWESMRLRTRNTSCTDTSVSSPDPKTNVGFTVRNLTPLEAHCLDTVRQVLMCNVDTGLLGQVWVDPEKPTAFPDFNTRHVCKNYNDIREWARKLQVRSQSPVRCRRHSSADARLRVGSSRRPGPRRLFGSPTPRRCDCIHTLIIY
jgi:hypothetical protein